MAKSWKYQGAIFFLFLLMETVSGMEPSSSSTSVQISTLGSQLSTLETQLIQLQQQVDVLQQENMEDKERIIHLEERVSRLESLCGSTERETEKPGYLMAIGGSRNYEKLRSAEVVNTSCDFPLPEARTGHMSVTTADGKILVCGGETSSDGWTYSGPATSCLQFDHQSKSWKEHSQLLTKHRHHASTVTLSGGTYRLGGQDEWGEAVSSSEFLATGSSVWIQGPHIPGIGVRNSCAAKLSDTEFVILGGSYDGTQALVYNVLSGEWREWPRLTEYVWGQSCLGLGDTVLMAGGYLNGFDTGNFVTTGWTVIFDTKTGSAREVASLKYPRAHTTMVLYGGKPLILGGYNGNNGSVDRIDGETWNMDTETWEEADIHLNIARSEFSLVTMPEEIGCE